ncbi:MAG: glycosyltransferase family 2 protein [Candidatus Riflebacteria bacterium]|nr:glycosyltransferase family 2 protein [Candidatus Riflebacteria bacterium]
MNSSASVDSCGSPGLGVPAEPVRASGRLCPRPPPALLSIVIPIYNEEQTLPHLRERMTQLMADLQPAVELILVDDGTTDRSYELLCDWAKADGRVKVIALSRNFGHQLATTAGLRYARGDAVVIMDADLQDPPELVPAMVQGYCEGYEVVYGQRTERLGETAFKRYSAFLFYQLMRRLISPDLPANVGDFRLLGRRILSEINRLHERDRFLRGLVSWAGFPQKALPYLRQPRVAGETKYPVLKMVRFATNAIVSFSDLPLRIIMWLGLGSVALSALLCIWAVGSFFLAPPGLVPGWASIIVILCFFSGAILSALGMIGLYVGRIYTEVQRRPLFLVAQTRNLEEPTAAPP